MAGFSLVASEGFEQLKALLGAISIAGRHMKMQGDKL